MLEKDFEIDMDAPLAVAFKKRKLQTRSKRKKPPQVAATSAEGGERLQASSMMAEDSGPAPSGVTVSLFASVEDHFEAVETISKLFGELESPGYDAGEINRLSSSITFLKEWRHLNYNPRTIRFASQNENLDGNDIIDEITLPQFSAATVPKKGTQTREAISSYNNDCVLYVGGSIWALDWCPRGHQHSDCDMTTEFVAVSAHPPESPYHKIGAPQTGRGVIQIWCLLNIVNDEVPSEVQKKKRSSGRAQMNSNSTNSQRPRGRPRKKPVNESLDSVDCITQCEQAFAIQNPEDSSSLLCIDTVSNDGHEQLRGKGSQEDLPSQVEKKQNQNSGRCQTDKAISTMRKRPSGKSRRSTVDELSGADEHFDTTNSGTEKYVLQRVEGAKLAITTTKQRGLKSKAKTKEQSNGDCLYLANGEDKKSSSFINAQTSPRLQIRQGRQRKKPAKLSDYVDTGRGDMQTLAIEYHEDSSSMLTAGVEYLLEQVHPHNDNVKSTSGSSKTPTICYLDSTKSTSMNCNAKNTMRDSIPKNVVLPRMMLCLGHNGKVAWDIKWQPSNTYNKHRMGYLAVILGNGALEVWEVPFPRVVKVIYTACEIEGTDPRFMKLEPVFKCSKLKCGGRQSIPLTLEWSTSSPHDMILAGCHDGVVALWKFAATNSCEDTRPLLCFSADTVPIRALAWAPAESDTEAANVIVTAGHKGMKFWDIRDPFRPLWTFNPVQRIIYSLDWLPDPRCVIVSFDDGTLNTLSLVKAAYDVSVTGQPFVGKPQQGFASYLCSSFPIWSLHVSPKTGMVAYCGADGNTLRFQLTIKAVERDPIRNRAPHFLCGSLAEVESKLTVITRESDTPYPMKKSMNEWGDTPRSKRGFLAVSGQQKRAKEHKKQTSTEQPLALCFGNDPGSDYDSDPSAAQKNKQAHKCKTASKAKLKADEKALISRDEDIETVQKEADEKSDVVNEIESFPPKIVAIHRVRWNMNEGSEKWLCYGGASGILRCQEIDFSIC